MTGTLIMILPTNKQLLNPALDTRSAERGTGLLLARWGKLHAVRSRAVAVLLLLYLLIFAKS